MRHFACLILLLALSAILMAKDHPVPTNRAGLKDGDSFPYVVSKIAPLEWWAFEASPADIKRENYPSDGAFQMSLHNTWDFPRFCFSMFRPKPEAFVALMDAVRSYNGAVFWGVHDDCISAYSARPTFVAPAVIPEGTSLEDYIAQMQELTKNPPKADPEFVKKAMADLPKLGAYLEDRLGLKDKAPQQFDPQWLTKEGLSKHPPGDEDFIDGGSWSVELAKDPEKLASDNTLSPNVEYLNFGVSAFDTSLILEELGVNWEKYGETNDLGPVASEYPQLSKLTDDIDDVIYSPDEAEALLNECIRADEVVKKPASIRALDNLTRIARWAKKSGYGIYFGGQ